MYLLLLGNILDFSMKRLQSTLFFIFFLFFLQLSPAVFSQLPPSLLKDWVKKLESENGDSNLPGILQEFNKKDSFFVDAAIHQLENQGSVNPYFIARILQLKANQVYRFNYFNKKILVQQYFKEAFKEVYRTGDEYFNSKVCENFATLMFYFHDFDLATFYYLQAEEINEYPQNHFKNSGNSWLPLGEILFHGHDYEKSIYYLRKGLCNLNDTITSNYLKIKYWNAVGQGYQQLGKMDSAMINYETSIQIAQKLNDSIWIGINSGYMGQIFFLKKQYNQAKQYLEYGYSINKNNDGNIAAYTLQWLAKVNLAQGKNDSALIYAKDALAILNKSQLFLFQKQNFLQSIYYTTADIYRSLGKTDSCYHYFQSYLTLHDSLEKLATLHSINIEHLRINTEKNYRTIQSLENEKNTVALKRDFIIAVLTLLFIIALLYANRLRLKYTYKALLALQQKVAADAEVELVKEQLLLFTKNIIEKTDFIEKLEQQAKHKETGIEHRQIINDLCRQTILTTEDWGKFKYLFEKIHPYFLLKLKEKAIDITAAEQRMAALIILNITIKQMSSILGISPNSVYKTKQRLRQRFNFTTDIHLEEYLTNLN